MNYRICNVATVVCFLAATFATSICTADELGNWHRFRGPDGNGVAEDAKPPTSWSNSSENIKWKLELPGKGHSSPIVWGDKIFVTTAVDTRKTPDGEVLPEPAAGEETRGRGRGGRGGPPPEGRGGRPDGPPPEGRGGRGGRGGPPQGRGRGRGGRGRGGRGAAPKSINEFWVYCINRADGKVVWKKKVNEAVPHEGTHNTNNYASGSPVTNGEHVYASFGSHGIYCLDMEGNVVWDRDLGDMRTRNSFGEGVSPALHEDTLIVNWDHEDQSFIEAVDAKTGKTKWKQDRDELTTWATPVVVKHNDRTQVITNGKKVRSYDLKDGSLIWECGGQTGNAIPTPMILDDTAIAMTGWRSSACVAIPLDSKGDVTDSDKLGWKSRDIGPYVPTGVLYKGTIYGTKSSQAVLSAVDAKTGKKVFNSERLPGIQTLYSSLVAANDHIYVTGRNGTTLVLKHGPEFEIVSTNELGEPVDATPAIADKQIFVRSASNLYCFEDSE